MDNELRITRLKQLRYMMNNHAKIFKKRKIKFDIETWLSKELEVYETAESYDGCSTNSEEVFCGFAACVLGSAALYRPFIQQGLGAETNCSENDRNETRVTFEPVYKSKKGFSAGKAFFGLSDYEAEDLFLSCSYFRALEHSTKIKPKDVVKRIDTLIEHYERKRK